jgi:hypothetical protein
MTDLAKAIAFATDCLKWTNANAYDDSRGTVVYSGGDLAFTSMTRPSLKQPSRNSSATVTIFRSTAGPAT